MKTGRHVQLISLFSVATTCALLAAEGGFVPLFPGDGVPKGWVVRAWDDVRNPAQVNPVWNLDEQTQSVKRHNDAAAPPVKDRPRRGHIGFQELSRGAEHVMIRSVRI